jgi:hypothetical protein
MRRLGMTGSRLLVLAVVALGSAALPSVAGAHHLPTSVQVVAVLNSGVTSETGEYSLRRLRDLRIVGWWNVPGAHVQRIELRAPDGSLYQRLTQPFTTNNAPHVTGDGRLRGTAVRTLLPVGGTWIAEYSLVGTWEIHLFMDSSRTPIATHSIVLTP